jgi:hypothetical protein
MRPRGRDVGAPLSGKRDIFVNGLREREREKNEPNE